MGDELVLNVEDSGAGIPADAMETIRTLFHNERGRAGDRARIIGGYGIVQEHSGSIFAENQESGGARFGGSTPSA